LAGQGEHIAARAGDLSAAGDIFGGVTKAYGIYKYPGKTV
jgi:hypothetical protein